MTKAFFLLMILSANFVCAGHPIVIGIAGGTGSGKSTLAKKIQSSGLNSVLIEQDCYYKDLAHLSMAERNATNFDHPLSIDFERLYEDLLSLKSGSSIEKPIYSFKSHAREKGATHVSSADIIVVEGILIFQMSASEIFAI